MFTHLKDEFTLTGNDLKILLAGAYRNGYKAARLYDNPTGPEEITGDDLLELIETAGDRAEMRINTLVTESICPEDKLYNNPALPEGPTGIVAKVQYR